MTNTGQTVQTLKDFRDTVKETMLSRQIVTFNINDIEIDNEKMSYKGEELSEGATKKILSRLRVKNNFMEVGKTLNPTDWKTVKEKIKMASADQIVHGRVIKEPAGMTRVDDVYMAAPKTTGVLEIDTIFGEVIDSIIGTGKDISTKSTTFLQDKDEVVLTLLDNDKQIDVFANGTDMWKTGKRITWNGMNFSIAPFFERLVCTNGNTAPQYGFKANISNNKFNIQKIKKVLEKEITFESDTLDKYLVEAGNHLKSTNISVREYMKFRSFFNENDHGDILTKWLDTAKMNRMYGCVVAEMPNLWKTTADTNINAYDFFNTLTYLASHPDEVKISDRERVDLQIKSSDLLFAEKLDLEQLAPKVKWN